MIETASQATVLRQITVRATPARAFEFFTQQMAKWWPATHHIAKEPFTGIVMERQQGGRWFEVAASGSECDWGRVLDWEPPSLVALSWHLNAQWQYDPNPEHASRVEIRFEPAEDGFTRVQLEHSGFERHGEGYETIFAGVGSPGGWNAILEGFSKGLPTE